MNTSDNKNIKSNKNGFTLVELLIVIAIIAILASILFPVFARARENARRASCQSNLKEIALAFHMYSSDYDERLPHAWDSNLAATNPYSTCNYCSISVGTTEPVVWPAKIEPYLKNRQVFSCPDSTTLIKSKCFPAAASAVVDVWGAGAPVVSSKTSGWSYYGASQVGYGYNVFYLGGNRYYGYGGCLNDTTNSSLPYSNGIGAALATIADPSRTVLVCDNTFSNQNAPAFIDFPSLHNLSVTAGGDFGCANDDVSPDGYDPIPERHFDGLNVAFLDGHVKWMHKEALMYGLGSEACNGTGAAGAIHSNTDPNFLWNRF